MNTLHKQLIKEAVTKYGQILPIGGKPQHDKKSFTGYERPDGTRYEWFWFEDINGSSHIIQKLTTCPQCGGLLQFNLDNVHGHCACENRGQ